MLKSTKLIFVYLLLPGLFFLGLNNCATVKSKGYRVVNSFHSETGIAVVYLMDTSLLRTARSWQGKGDYPGVDNWTTAKIANNLNLYGGLPGQSEYYTITQTLVENDTIMVPYWKSLQVKPHKEFGYRPKVGVYGFKDSIVVAIAKTLKNREYGKGGAWQIYVEDYESLLFPLDTVELYEKQRLNK